MEESKMNELKSKIKYGYLLPIGSVVKLKGVEQKMMVIGVLQKGEAVPDKTFDYVAVQYPEGLHDVRLNVGFDQSDIEEVVFRGYEDNDRAAFLILLEAVGRAMEKKAGEKSENETIVTEENSESETDR